MRHCIVFTFLLLSCAQWPARAQERRDVYGDPLPKGAAARLGTLRYRHEGGFGSSSTVHFLRDMTLVSLSDGRIKFWDGKTGRAVRVIEPESRAALVDVSPDRKLVAAVSKDFNRVTRQYNCLLEVWRAKDGEGRTRISWKEDSGGAPTCVSFSPDASRIVTVSNDGVLKSGISLQVMKY